MCWNQEVSLNTFLFSGFVLALIIYNNNYTKYKIKGLNNIWVCLFFASFVSMQLIEFFIWRNINNYYYNNVFSLTAATLLFIQPIASLMILQNIPLRNVLIISYLMIAVPYSVYKFSTKHIHSVISKNGHLTWKFFDTDTPFVVWIIWLFFFLFRFVYEKNCVGLIFGLVTLLIAVVNYKNGNTIGSMWCWSVNSIMIYYAFHLLIYLPFLEKSGIC